MESRFVRLICLNSPSEFDRKIVMEAEELKYQRLREDMVRRQIEGRGIGDKKVLTALYKVPRHLFVSEALRD